MVGFTQHEWTITTDFVGEVCMEHIITDVIIGVIILSLLLVVIPIYRNQSEQMASVIEITDQNEKIKEVIFSDLPKCGDVVSGRYIKELVYYYANKDELFLVRIKKSGTLYFLTETFYDAIHSILNEDHMFFTVTIATPNENSFMFVQQTVITENT